MISAEGERVNLGKNLKARGNVEAWLTAVEQAMMGSIRRLAKQGYQEYPESVRTTWIRNQPAQLVITVSNIFWCREIEEIIGGLEQSNSKDMTLMVRFLKKSIDQLSELCDMVRSELTSLERKSLVALITIDVHNRDIVEALVHEKVSSLNDFSWQMQARPLWVPRRAEAAAPLADRSPHLFTPAAAILL